MSSLPAPDRYGHIEERKIGGLSCLNLPDSRKMVDEVEYRRRSSNILNLTSMRVRKVIRTIFFSFFSPCLPLFTERTASERSNLPAQWKPQAQFAVSMWQKEKGLYERHGIDLTLLRGGLVLLLVAFLLEQGRLCNDVAFPRPYRCVAGPRDY